VINRKTVIFVMVILGVPLVASAVLTFQQLDGNTFTISHKVKAFGGRGQAMDLVFEKAASLCIAAGYSHLKIVDQASHAGGGWQSPNATVTVKFFHNEAEDRVACEGKADSKYVEQAKKKLTKRGYEGPIEPVEPVDPSSTLIENSHCTVEQITAMVSAGLSVEQIKAACESEE